MAIILKVSAWLPGLYLFCEKGSCPFFAYFVTLINSYDYKCDILYKLVPFPEDKAVKIKKKFHFFQIAVFCHKPV